MRVEVIKYQGFITTPSLEHAQLCINEAKERHPDREYTILTNMRAYSGKYVAAQVKKIVVDLPTEEDLDLPPMPEPPTASWGSDPQGWDDYYHEQRRRGQLVDAAQASVMKAVREKLNP